MNKKGFANIALVLIIVAIIAVSGYFVLSKKSATPTPLQQIETSNGPVLAPNETAPSTQADVTPVQQTRPFNGQTPAIQPTKYDDKKVTECVDNYQLEQKRYNSEFGPGYIVVGFPSSTSLVSAKEVIKSHGLAPRETSVGFHSYLYADVTVGQEFLWACRLKQDARIRYADPSPTLTIQ